MGILDEFKRNLTGLIAELDPRSLLDFGKGQTLQEAMQNRMHPGSLRPNLSNQQMVDAGLNIAGMAPMGMFIGKGAKTWDALKHAEALKMAEQGKTPREIWPATGNWLGPDKNWRQEIPDNTAKLQSMGDWSGRSDMAYKHDNLYSSYPELSGTAMRLDPEIYGGNLLEIGGKNHITAGTKQGNTIGKSTVTHELQHAIQQLEGWAKGGSHNQFEKEIKNADDLIEGYNRTLTTVARDMDKAREYGNKDALASLKRQYDELMGKKSMLFNQALQDPYDSYRRLAGEAESRATQARVNMDMPERLSKFPEDSYDVPIDKLIYKYGDGPAMSAPTRPRNALGQEIPPTQYELAHAEAQRVAALPVDQGGLGLPVGNAAMDRARAMGFDTNLWHGQRANEPVREYFEGGLGSMVHDAAPLDQIKSIQSGAGNGEGGALFMSDDLGVGAGYAGKYGAMYPLKVNAADFKMSGFNKDFPVNGTQAEKDAFMRGADIFNRQLDKRKHRYFSDEVAAAKREGFGGVAIRNVEDSADSPVYDYASDVYAAFGAPVRSRFAAFNPAKRDSADILAGLYPWAIPTGLLGSTFLLPSDAEAR